MKKICVLNGGGGVGKDSFARFCSEFCEAVYHISSVNEVKDVARTIGWTGEKDEKSRKFLSDLKDLMTEYNDRPLNYILEKITYFQEKSPDNSVIFIDVREPDEIEKLVKTNDDIVTVLIVNDNAKKVNSNHADANVLDYSYDVRIYNNGSLDDLRFSAETFVNYLLNGLELEDEETLDLCDLICGCVEENDEN